MPNHRASTDQIGCDLRNFAHLIRNRTGNLRFQLPQALPPYDTSFSATEYGPACPQQPVGHLPSDLPTETVNYLTIWLVNEITSAEDCVFIYSPVQC